MPYTQQTKEYLYLDVTEIFLLQDVLSPIRIIIIIIIIIIIVVVVLVVGG